MDKEILEELKKVNQNLAQIKLLLNNTEKSQGSPSSLKLDLEAKINAARREAQEKMGNIMQIPDITK